MILAFGSLFVSCDDTLTLQSIKVTQKPTAEYQYLGESLDTTGMVVTGYYNKGYESVIADYTVSPAKFTTLGTNTVTVSYQGKSDSFEVNVVENKLESIGIKTQPVKTVYLSGEKLSLIGLVVEANYTNGSVETITDYTTYPIEGTILSTSNKGVIVSYKGKEAVIKITVIDGNLQLISIKTPPTKTTYAVGDKLDLTGMVVEGYYIDGTTEAITDYTTTPQEGTALTASDKVVLIEYSGLTAEQPIVVGGSTPTPVVTYTVAFDSKGGTPAVKLESVQSGECVTAPDPAPKRDGYTFQHWYKDSEDTAYDFSTPVTGDMALYAKWTGVSYNITYYLQGGDAPATANPSTYTYGTGVASFNSPTRTNNIFKGWFDAASGGNKVESISATDTGNKTLYAQWLELKPIGGRVFYMHNDNGATYTFYKYDEGDSKYVKVDVDQANGDASTKDTIRYKPGQGQTKSLWDTVEYYTVDNKGKNAADKFYVYDNETRYGTAEAEDGLASYKGWGNGGTTIGAAGVAPKTDGIGQGWYNTEACLGKAGVTWEYYSVFTYVKECRDYDGNNDGVKEGVGGCTDWFIPSKAELDMLRFSGLVDSWFAKNGGSYIWSSVEYNSDSSSLWDYYSSRWYDDMSKDDEWNSVVAVRAF